MTVSTLAGGTGAGLADAVDIRPAGFGLTADGLYVLDESRYGGWEDSAQPDIPVGISEALRKVDPATGAMTVLADTQTPGFIDRPNGGVSPAAGGAPAAGAPDGSLYWIDHRAGYLRKRDPSGKITNVAGDGKVATTATRCPSPTGDPFSINVGGDDLAVGSSGQVYLNGGCGPGPGIVQLANGHVSVVAGNGANWTPSNSTGDGGRAIDATFKQVTGFGAGPGNTLYVVDGNYRIREIDANGIITTVAGGTNGHESTGDGGPATAAGMDATDVAPHPDGSYDIAEYTNQRIRHVTAAGTISTVATDVLPYRMAADANGIDYWSDNSGATQVGSSVSRLTASNVVQRVVGVDHVPTCCHSGDDGPAVDARLGDVQYGLAVDGSGRVVFSDAAWVRAISPSGTIRTLAMPGSPAGLVIEPDGSVVFANTWGYSLQRISPAGVLTTIADVGPVLGLARDSHGNYFMAHLDPNGGSPRIAKLTPDGQLSCYAYCPGEDSYGYGDGGSARKAVLKRPLGLAMDPQDNLYLADADDNTVRRISPDGTISTVVSNGNPEADGGGHPMADTSVTRPSAITAFGPDDLVVSDADRVISIVNGHATAINSGPRQYEDTALGDGGRADAASFNTVQALAHDSAGNLYLSDTGNGRIRKLTVRPAASTAPTISGAATRSTTYGKTVAVNGTAAPGATVGVWFRKAGTTGFVQRRTLTASSSGAWSTTYVADNDYRLYATVGSAQSPQVLVQVAPTINGALTRTVKKNSNYTITGTGNPGAVLTLHFHKAGTATNDYSILRTVTVGAKGAWSRAYLASVDYRFFASLPNGQTSPTVLAQAR